LVKAELVDTYRSISASGSVASTPDKGESLQEEKVRKARLVKAEKLEAKKNSITF